MTAYIKEINGKVGRPRRSEIDKLRARIWYWTVKSRGNWKDSKLDEQFGSIDGPRLGPNRTRVFGQIKKNGVLPRTGQNKSPNFSVVYRVDNHPNFNGTSMVIDSPFWELLENPPSSLEEANQLVQKLLDLHNLTRFSGRSQIEWMMLNASELFNRERNGLYKHGVEPYEASLQDACKDIPTNLNSAALFGALYLESCLSFNIDNAKTLGIYFRIAIEEFCSYDWLGGEAWLLQDIAINRILFGIKNYLPHDGFNQTLPPPRCLNIEAQGFIVSKTHPNLDTFEKWQG